MVVDWNTNWAPTIVTMLITAVIMLLGIWLQSKWVARRGPPSESIEATYPEGTTRIFKGRLTWSRRSLEETPEGGRKFSEEFLEFESEEGISTVSAEEIDDMLNGGEAEGQAKSS